jgi:hypothetical protein
VQSTTQVPCFCRRWHTALTRNHLLPCYVHEIIHLYKLQFYHRTNAACIVALTNKEKIDHTHCIIRTVILCIVSQFDNGILFKFASILVMWSIYFVVLIPTVIFCGHLLVLCVDYILTVSILILINFDFIYFCLYNPERGAAEHWV